MRWTKDKIYRKEFNKLLEAGLEEEEASKQASINAEEIFGDLCDSAYEEKRDRDMERDR